jgi:hypothetical protein
MSVCSESYLRGDSGSQSGTGSSVAALRKRQFRTCTPRGEDPLLGLSDTQFNTQDRLLRPLLFAQNAHHEQHLSLAALIAFSSLSFAVKQLTPGELCERGSGRLPRKSTACPLHPCAPLSRPMYQSLIVLASLTHLLSDPVPGTLRFLLPGCHFFPGPFSRL